MIPLFFPYSTVCMVYMDELVKLCRAVNDNAGWSVEV